jgi:hypothetical protein
MGWKSVTSYESGGEASQMSNALTPGQTFPMRLKDTILKYEKYMRKDNW